MHWCTVVEIFKRQGHRKSMKNVFIFITKVLWGMIVLWGTKVLLGTKVQGTKVRGPKVRGTKVQGTKVH